MDKREQAAEKARQADRILNDPLVKEAIRGMKDVLFCNFITSKYKATDEREELYRQAQAVRSFEQQFEGWIKDGQAARLDIDRKLETVV